MGSHLRALPQSSQFSVVEWPCEVLRYSRWPGRPDELNASMSMLPVPVLDKNKLILDLGTLRHFVLHVHVDLDPRVSSFGKYYGTSC